MNTTRIIFVSGTRADYGKIKPLVSAVEEAPEYTLYLFVSGMHLSKEHGSTYRQILGDGYENVKLAWGTEDSSQMDINMANTIFQLSEYVRQVEPDFLIVHGDRVDALAGACVCLLNNICCIHIEGGEVTGTVDDSMRHAISKMAHYHLVSNEEAQIRLQQMGENPDSIYVIGSPDIDVMISDSLPDLEQVRDVYGISFEKYAILIYHPVVTELDKLAHNVHEVFSAIEASGRNYVAVYPNNDLGSDIILSTLQTLQDNPHFRMFRSLEFEYFLTLLKHSDFIIGNSSAGIREACTYGIPCIDIGTRQQNRYPKRGLANIIHVSESRSEILSGISQIDAHRQTSYYFGKGNSRGLFLEILQQLAANRAPIQKKFIDSDETQVAINAYINEVLF